MTTLYLVRHGQASFKAANYDQLSELGYRQAAWLGEHFAARGIVFSRAVCGTLERQRQDRAHRARRNGGVDAFGRPDARRRAPGLERVLGRCAVPRLPRRGLGKGARPGATCASSTGRSRRRCSTGPRRNSPARCRKPGASSASGWPPPCARPARGCRPTPACSRPVPAARSAAAWAGMLQAPAQAAIELNLQFRNSAFCEIFVSPRSMRLVSFNCIPHLERPDRPRRDHAFLSAPPIPLTAAAREG